VRSRPSTRSSTAVCMGAWRYRMGTVRPARLCMQRHVVRGCRYARCGWHASAAGVCSEASTAASTPLPRNRWTPQSQAKCQPTRRVARICRRRSPSPRKCHVTLPCRSRSAAVVVVLGTGHITATRSTQKAPTPGARSCYRMARDAQSAPARGRQWRREVHDRHLSTVAARALQLISGVRGRHQRPKGDVVHPPRQ
jgi:hypothetical protein